MRQDDHLIFEAFKGKPESADERKERVQRGWDANKNRWAKWKMENPAAATKHAAKKAASENAETAEQRIMAVKQAVAQAKGQIAQAKTQGQIKHYGDGLVRALGKSENAENAPHGYPQGMTAIQNLVLNELKKHGFELTKIGHADKERDAYPTVFMKRNVGAMHTVAEIDGMGAINGEPYKEYLANLNEKSKRASGMRPDAEDPYYDTWQSIAQDHAEDAEGTKQPYNAMTHLTQAANEIRDILQTHADDEAQVEHIISMAQIILGPKSDHTDAEYRKMLDGLIVILNRFIIVPMN